MRLRHRPFLLALSFTMFTAASAGAQSDADKATARELGGEGQDALDKKDFKTAEDRFRRADQLYHAPTLALGLARAYAANGKYVEAHETYNRIIREGAPAGAPAAFQSAVDAAKNEIGAVAPKIGAVVISVTGATGPKVTLDDQPFSNAALGVKRAANPGTHVVRASAEGYKPAEARVTVTEGGTATANLTLENDPNAAAAAATGPAAPVTGPAAPAGGVSAPPAESEGGGSSVKTIGIVLMGVGAAGLAAGAITGIMAMGKHSSLSDECPDGKCAEDKQSDIDGYKTLGTVSTVGFIAGGVLAAGGAVLFFTAPKEGSRSASLEPWIALPHRRAEPRAFVSPVIGPLSVGAVGTF
jgi:hypothetical protein